jgi:hypothetical protein
MEGGKRLRIAMVQHLQRERFGQIVGWALRRALVQLGGAAEREPVRMLAERFNFLPDRFLWRGEQRRVREIVRSWDIAGSRAPRRYFAVICQDGAHCTLLHDLRGGSWYLV